MLPYPCADHEHGGPHPYMILQLHSGYKQLSATHPKYFMHSRAHPGINEEHEFACNCLALSETEQRADQKEMPFTALALENFPWFAEVTGIDLPCGSRALAACYRESSIRKRNQSFEAVCTINIHQP
jgi:hypothetical protein